MLRRKRMENNPFKFSMIRNIFELEQKPGQNEIEKIVMMNDSNREQWHAMSIEVGHGKSDISTPDCFAYYANRKKHAGNWGIFLITRTMLECFGAGSSNSISTEALVRTVCVHEFFHMYSELTLGDVCTDHKCPHGKPGFCPIEEAAANYFAHAFAEKNYGKELPALEKCLFMSNLPGYGEYYKMSNDILWNFGQFKTENSCYTPDEYHSKIENQRGDIDVGLKRVSARALWDGLTSNTALDSLDVPFWIDDIS